MRTRQHSDTAAAPVVAGLAHPRSVPTIEVSETVDESDQPFAEGARDEIDPDLRHRMISEAAYHLYEGRGYADGYDLDDWLQAEAAVDHVVDRKPGAGG